MDIISAKELLKELSKTVVGQEEAKHVVCAALYFHFVRFCMKLESESEINTLSLDLIPAKTNALLMGPTGSGKTFIVKESIKAIRTILGMKDICPLLEVDCTELSARGWEGDCLTDKLRGMHASTLPSTFDTGVVFLDEFDKICMTAIGKGGHDHNKATQYNLLKPVEGTIIDGRCGPFNTDGLLFIMAGNFAEIRHKRTNSKKVIGFAANSSGPVKLDYHLELDNIGMVSQLVGRTPHIAELSSLSKTQLLKILNGQILPKYDMCWKYIGKELKIKAKDKNIMVDKCYNRKTGARGLHADVVSYLEKELFK